MKKLMVDGREVLTAKQAAAVLRISRSTLTVWNRLGRFPDGAVVETDQGRLYDAEVIRALNAGEVP